MLFVVDDGYEKNFESTQEISPLKELTRQRLIRYEWKK